MALKAGRKGVFAFRHKTADQTEQAGIDEQGRVWYSGGSYTLPVATGTTLGGVKVAEATETQTEDVGIDSNGKLKTKPQGSYTLPVATSETLGGVKVNSATDEYTENVGINADGVLKVKPAAGGITWTKKTLTSFGDWVVTGVDHDGIAVLVVKAGGSAAAGEYGVGNYTNNEVVVTARAQAQNDYLTFVFPAITGVDYGYKKRNASGSWVSAGDIVRVSQHLFY